MEPRRFFYSTNGSDVAGPVTEDELRRLWKEKRLGAGSFVRGACESSWTPLASALPVIEEPARVRSTRIVPSEVFAMARKSTTVAAPKELAPSSPPMPVAVALSAPMPVPASKVAKPLELEVVAEAPRDAYVLSLVLNISAMVATLGAAIAAAISLSAAEGNDVDAWENRVLYLLIAIAAITLVPWLLSFLRAGIARVAIRSGGIVALALLVTVIACTMPPVPVLTRARVNLDAQKREAQQEIASKGFYAADTDQAQQNLEKLKRELSGDGVRARVDRAILSVTTDLVPKVKVSDTIEKNCVFAVDAAKSNDAFTGQIAGISMLRDAQNDVVFFFQGYDQHCRDALAGEKLSPTTVDAVVSDARKGAHVDQLITLWQEKMKLSDDHVARLLYLQKNWGRWQLANGQVMFSDDTLEPDYDKLAETIQGDLDNIRDTQKQIFQ